MRKFSLLIALSTIIYVANSQTVHGIIFANTNDKTIGKYAEIDRALMEQVYQDIAQKLGYNLKLNLFQKDDFTFKNLDSLQNNLKVNERDLIIFYIVSHGYGRDNDSFPRISIKNTKVNRNRIVTYTEKFPISTLHNSLLSKYPQAQTILTISQACNNIVANSPEPVFQDAQLHKSTLQDYQALFTNKKSRIKITSSQPGKTSWTGSKGSYFTRALNSTLLSYNSSNKSDHWKTLSQNVKVKYDDLQELMKKKRRGRRPVVEIQYL